MRYNQKNIYSIFGQYGHIVTIILKSNSNDFKIYGSNLTGVIRYKNNEREILQKSLIEDVDLTQLGKLKIDDNVNTFSQNLKFDLYYEGIEIDSIFQISSIPFSFSNDYVKKELRELGTHIALNFSTKNFDAPKAFIQLFDNKIKNGFKLTEFEEFQNGAYKIINDNYLIPEEFKGNEEIRFYVLEYKYLYSELELTKDEDLEFKEIIQKRTKTQLNILFKILKSESNNVLSFLNGRKDIIEILNLLVTNFKPERLTITKTPVWWNLERYLHIILGHVSGLQFCIKSMNNTLFQYHFKDVKDLIKEILDDLTVEINLWFEKNPERDFVRKGGMSYYYKGDYYYIHIRKDGLLQTLYKNNKQQEIGDSIYH